MGQSIANRLIPPDFGAERGTEISNKATILKELDSKLNVKKPPAVEYIFVEPHSSVKLLGSFGFNFYNPFGQ